MGDFLEKEYLPKARNTDGINAIQMEAIFTIISQNLGLPLNLTPDEINKIGLKK